MKKVGVICLIICCVLSVFGAAFSASASEQDAQNSMLYGYYSVDASNAFLGSGARVNNVQAAFLYETRSQTLMYAWNADAQMDPASLVKIMTAYVAIDKGDLSDVVTVTADALANVPSDAMSINLVDGEMLTLEDLLYCMLVGSANDAAAVIAHHISADEAAFVAEMNRYAQEMGCKNTNFTNSTGLYDEQQVITARDAARILEVALRNDQFRTIFCAENFNVPKTNKSDKRFLSTGNYLMAGNQDEVTFYLDERVKGGRTGIANDGLRTVAVVAESGSMELISVVMGSESELSESGNHISVFGGYQETTALLDAGFKDLKVAQVLYSNQALSQQEVLNGDCDVVLGSQDSVYAILTQNAKVDTLTYRYSHTGQGLEAPIEKGDVVSTVEIWNGGMCVAQAELYAMNSVAVKQNQPTNGAGVSENSGGIGRVLLTVLLVLAGVIVLLYVYRQVRIALIRKKKQRNRRNRRRSY